MKIGDKIFCQKNFSFAGGAFLKKGKLYKIDRLNDYQNFYVIDETGNRLYLQDDILKKFFNEYKRKSLNNKLKKIRLL